MPATKVIKPREYIRETLLFTSLNTNTTGAYIRTSLDQRHLPQRIDSPVTYVVLERVITKKEVIGVEHKPNVSFKKTRGLYLRQMERSRIMVPYNRTVV